MELFLRNSLADSTQQTYDLAKRRYIHFCMHHNISPVPASEHHFCQYVAYLSLAELSHSTIKCYLSAVHIAQKAGDPGISQMPRLKQVLRGIKRTQAKSKRKMERLPITIKLRQYWKKEATLDAVMLWAAAFLCFFVFFLIRGTNSTIGSRLA